MNLRGGGAPGYGGVQNRVGNANPGQARQVKCYNCNGTGHIAKNCTQPKRPQNSEYYKDKMLLMQAQENGVALDAEQLLFLVDNVFQVDDYDSFDSDVDEAPMAQTMFLANLSSADPVIDEAGPSYDSDILSEVQDHDHYQDAVCAHHEEHTMHDNVQLNHVVDSHINYTSDGNMISYDQYVKDNAVTVVHSNISFVPTDAYMMIYNDMYEPHAQSISNTSQNTAVENSLTAELATYKEQVKLYERRTKFELTEREQMINKQLRLVISDFSFKEETLKKELHSIKLQLAFTINHNKSMGIQKALTKDIKEMKDVFEELEAKVAQNVVDRKHDAIERKNLLIANDNLIAECLSKEVFSVATNFEPNVAQFTEMHVANTIVEARCLKLEPELSNLCDKSRQDNHEENNREAHLDYLRHLKESVKTIRDIVEEAKVVRPLDRSIVSAFRYTKHSQKLLEYAIGTFPQDSHQRDKKLAPPPLIRKKQVTFTKLSDKSKRVKRYTTASGLKPRSNIKKNRISTAKSVNKLHVEEQFRTNKSILRTSNRVDSGSRLKRTVVQIVLWYLDSGCSKHMTGNRSRLMNFVKKFIGTVRFGNDHFGAIMGYGDYVIGDSVISMVYYVERLGHNLFSVGQFCDSDLEVPFRKHFCYVRDTD
nr:integrase, catalytic region, zinc finger, CCHC-type, peptidase aspartic, catalytic [Tanacetum cinerariifolium]